MKSGGRLDHVCRVSSKMKPQENLHLSNDFFKKAPKEKRKRNTGAKPEHKELHETKNRASRRE